MNVKLLEKSGVIEGVELKLNAKRKKFYKVTIDKLAYNVFDFFPSFLQLSKNEIEIGDSVSVFYAESEYEYKGKPAMSRQLKRFVKDDPKPKPVEKPVKQIESLAEVPVEIERVDVHEVDKGSVKTDKTILANKQVVFADRDVLIVRQSSVKTAVEFTKKFDGLTIESILITAEEIEKWVLR